MAPAHSAVHQIAKTGRGGKGNAKRGMSALKKRKKTTPLFSFFFLHGGMVRRPTSKREHAYKAMVFLDSWETSGKCKNDYINFFDFRNLNGNNNMKGIDRLAMYFNGSPKEYSFENYPDNHGILEEHWFINEYSTPNLCSYFIDDFQVGEYTDTLKCYVYAHNMYAPLPLCFFVAQRGLMCVAQI